MRLHEEGYRHRVRAGFDRLYYLIDNRAWAEGRVVSLQLPKRVMPLRRRQQGP